jgi:hypothetical protein
MIATESATAKMTDERNHHGSNIIAPSDQRIAYLLAPKRGGLSS